MSSKTAQSVTWRYLRSKRAMVGNSFDPFDLTIKRVGSDRYLLEVSAMGTVSGSMQHVSDTLRFVSSDVSEMAMLFFTMGVPSHRYRQISKSPPVFETDGRIKCTCTVDFTFDDAMAREAFTEAIRPLGLVHLNLEF